MILITGKRMRLPIFCKSNLTNKWIAHNPGKNIAIESCENELLPIKKRTTLPFSLNKMIMKKIDCEKDSVENRTGETRKSKKLLALLFKSSLVLVELKNTKT